MGPLTGPASGYGTSQLDGVTLAAEEINARAEETRRRVELIPVDDQGNMSLAGDLVVNLVYEQEVNAIIGAINSAVTHVVEMVVAKTQVPMITTTSTDPSITRTGTYWVFRCLADDVLQGRALATRLFGTDGRKRVALFREDNRYGKMGGAEIARIAKEAGTPVVVDLFFSGKAERFDEPIEALRKSNADALVLWGLYTPCARLVRQIRDAGIGLPIYGADGMVHPAFLQGAGEAAEGVIVTFPFNPCRPDPVTRDFLSRFHARFGHAPDSFAAHSYDALQIIWAAIERGDCTDRPCIKDNMLQTKHHPGVTGTITLDKEGNDTREVELAVVSRGRFVPLSAPTGTPGPPGAPWTVGPELSGSVSCPGAPGTR